MSEQDQKAEIFDLIVRERIARDSGRWDEMGACWAEDSSIEVSWFRGNGQQFVEATRRLIRPDNINFHQIFPGVVTVRGDRALVDTPAELQSFSQLDGIDVNQSGHLHLLWRAVRERGSWLIAGLHAYYIRDVLIPCDPSRVPALDQARLAGYRQSYRYLSYILDSFGGKVSNELPGIDRPETVDALIADEQAWLAG